MSSHYLAYKYGIIETYYGISSDVLKEEKN
ncbi:hypothetical protein LPICM17_510005 [Lactococcus piscium]|nr:hypothetical protein LPICM17_510005 [Lactococcus piscium]